MVTFCEYNSSFLITLYFVLFFLSFRHYYLITTYIVAEDSVFTVAVVLLLSFVVVITSVDAVVVMLLMLLLQMVLLLLMMTKLRMLLMLFKYNSNVDNFNSKGFYFGFKLSITLLATTTILLSFRSLVHMKEYSGKKHLQRRKCCYVYSKRGNWA